jgi:rRNA maturation RNase YbeY
VRSPNVEIQRSLVIRNRQRTRRVDLAALRKMARWLLAECLCPGRVELGIHLVGAAEITRLNETFLGHAGPTDVIAFDHSDWPASLGGRARHSVRAALRSAPCQRRARSDAPYHAAKCLGHDTRSEWPVCHGELYISIDAAVAQARAFRTTWESELARYLIHGLLHLAGYDDHHPSARRRMKRAEDQLLRAVARRFPLCSLSKAAPAGAHLSHHGLESPKRP